MIFFSLVIFLLFDFIMGQVWFVDYVYFVYWVGIWYCLFVYFLECIIKKYDYGVFFVLVVLFGFLVVEFYQLVILGFGQFLYQVVGFVGDVVVGSFVCGQVGFQNVFELSVYQVKYVVGFDIDVVDWWFDGYGFFELYFVIVQVYY